WCTSRLYPLCVRYSLHVWRFLGLNRQGGRLIGVSFGETLIHLAYVIARRSKHRACQAFPWPEPSGQQVDRSFLWGDADSPRVCDLLALEAPRMVGCSVDWN